MEKVYIITIEKMYSSNIIFASPNKEKTLTYFDNINKMDYKTNISLYEYCEENYNLLKIK